MKRAGRSHYPKYRNGQHATSSPIEQRKLKGTCSEKTLSVFTREEYYTSLFFFFFLNERKEYMDLRMGGWSESNHLNRHLSFVKQFCPSGVDHWFIFGSDFIF